MISKAFIFFKSSKNTSGLIGLITIIFCFVNESSYNNVVEIPLVLYDCDYDDLQWTYEKGITSSYILIPYYTFLRFL